MSLLLAAASAVLNAGRPLAAALAALAALAATALPGCGSSGETDTGAAVSAYAYTVSGGLAGLDRQLTVSPDAVTIAEGGAEPTAVTIDPALLVTARDALEAAPLEEIADTLPEGGPTIPDDVIYTIEAGGTSITAAQTQAVDDRLQPVIDALDPVLIAALDQVNPDRS